MAFLRVLVAGKQGQLVRSLLEVGPARGIEIVAVGRPELELTDLARSAPSSRRSGPPCWCTPPAIPTPSTPRWSPSSPTRSTSMGRPRSPQPPARSPSRCHLSSAYVFDGTSGPPYPRRRRPASARRVWTHQGAGRSRGRGGPAGSRDPARLSGLQPVRPQHADQSAQAHGTTRRARGRGRSSGSTPPRPSTSPARSSPSRRTSPARRPTVRSTASFTWRAARCREPGGVGRKRCSPIRRATAVRRRA